MPPPPLIAIVDDDAGVRASLSSLLRSLGHAVRAYAHGQELLEDTRLPPVDCIISDAQMPVLDGVQLQQRLRARGDHVPMIFMTAFPTPALEARLAADGALAFLRKPVDAATLVAWLQRALDDRADHTKV